MAKARKRNRSVIVDSINTLRAWISSTGRAAITAALGRPIADYAPGASKVVNKGGRGVKAAGRGAKAVPAKLTNRRRAKYPLAELDTYTVAWMRRKRKCGTKLTTRLVKGAMKNHVRKGHPDNAEAKAFKASAGWMKRFMGRFRITWRRRNDNAKKSAAQLMPKVAKFIRELRELRRSRPVQESVEDMLLLSRIIPSVLEGDSVQVSGTNKLRIVFAGKYGIFGPCRTFNVDQHPLPFATGAQVATPFLAAMMEEKVTMRFGPGGSTHVWQPCDHHLGREYGRLMGYYYDEWMASKFDDIASGTVSTESEERRILLTQWCGIAYRHLEEERKAKEVPWIAAMLAGPIPDGGPMPEPSRFFKAFLRTGCLVTSDGSEDEEIMPHREIKDKLWEEALHLL